MGKAPGGNIASPGEWCWGCCTPSRSVILCGKCPAAPCADLQTPGDRRTGKTDPFWHVSLGQRPLCQGWRWQSVCEVDQC